MESDIRRENGAEKPLYVLFQLKVKFKCRYSPFLFVLKSISMEALGHLWEKRLLMVA